MLLVQLPNSHHISQINFFHLVNAHTSVVFLLGKEKNITSEMETKLFEERNTHGDIIQVNGLIEHYDNLTLKTLYTLKFFLRNGKCTINKARFSNFIKLFTYYTYIYFHTIYNFICQIRLFQQHLNTS